MNLDEIEDLIRRYLAAGVAVVVILAGPVTGAVTEPGDSAGRPVAVEEDGVEIRDGTPGADGDAEDPATGEDAPAEDDEPPAEPPEDGLPAEPPEDGAPDEDAAADEPEPGTAEPATEDGPPTPATAAERLDWGLPDRSEDFRTTDLAGWEPYAGPGHQGQGERSPEALAVSDGVLTISGDAEGTTGGMCWGEGQRYGRWEARARPAADPAYHALLLLWPDADDFPTGGQVDFLELTDPTRASAEFYLHFGEDDDQVRSEVQVDATRWHAWAVEWTAEGITGYVDGEEWFSSTDAETLPPGPMHLCVQLDFFPAGDAEVRPSRMDVDWVRQYGP